MVVEDMVVGGRVARVAESESGATGAVGLFDASPCSEPGCSKFILLFFLARCVLKVDRALIVNREMYRGWLFRRPKLLQAPVAARGCVATGRRAAKTGLPRQDRLPERLGQRTAASACSSWHKAAQLRDRPATRGIARAHARNEHAGPCAAGGLAPSRRPRATPPRSGECVDLAEAADGPPSRASSPRGASPRPRAARIDVRWSPTATRRDARAAPRAPSRRRAADVGIAPRAVPSNHRRVVAATRRASRGRAPTARDGRRGPGAPSPSRPHEREPPRRWPGSRRNGARQDPRRRSAESPRAAAGLAPARGVASEVSRAMKREVYVRRAPAISRPALPPPPSRAPSRDLNRSGSAYPYISANHPRSFLPATGAGDHLRWLAGLVLGARPPGARTSLRRR